MNDISRLKAAEDNLPPRLPLLCNGDRMTQAEFHRRYEAYPDDVKFELIGGIVYMASPLRWPHGIYHIKLAAALDRYASVTPGVEAGDNATTILGEESEPQPDLTMRILRDYGGQSQLSEGEYVVGAPELLVEVAYSSRAIDMNQKRDDYHRRPLRPNRQGVWRSKVFPGLWLDGPAVLARDSARVMAAVQRGLASRGHAAFVKRLQAAHRRQAGG